VYVFLIFNKFLLSIFIYLFIYLFIIAFSNLFGIFLSLSISNSVGLNVQPNTFFVIEEQQGSSIKGCSSGKLQLNLLCFWTLSIF